MMKQIIVDIKKLSNEYMKEHNLLKPYRVTSYVYHTNKIIEYGVPEKDIQDYYIGKIINYSLV